MDWWAFLWGLGVGVIASVASIAIGHFLSAWRDDDADECDNGW